MLQKCPAGIAFEDHHISSVDVFARFTHGAQKAFEHHIESTLLYCIAQPELRQLTVEVRGLTLINTIHSHVLYTALECVGSHFGTHS